MDSDVRFKHARIEWISLICIVLISASEANERDVLRLSVRGSDLIDPVLNETIRLVGFNLGNHLHEGDAIEMKSLVPEANAVVDPGAVMVHFEDAHSRGIGKAPQGRNTYGTYKVCMYV